MTKTNKTIKNKKQETSYKDLLISPSNSAPELIKMKHQRIVESACKVFFKKGYHPTTTRDIAKACDMSMGQLYHYISSKDDVLFLVHKHMQKIWYDHLINSGIEEIKLPVDRLDKALRHTLELIITNKKLFQFVYTESKYLKKKQLKNVLKIDDKNVVGFFRRLLDDVKKEKSIDCDVDFAANLIAYLSVFMALRGWNLKKSSTEEYIDLLIDFIMRGLTIK